MPEVRSTRVLFFDLTHAPAPDGWSARWLVEPVAGDTSLREPAAAGPGVLRDGVLTLDGGTGPDAAVGLTYHHWQFDARDDDPVRDALAYNDAVPMGRRAHSRPRLRSRMRRRGGRRVGALFAVSGGSATGRTS